MKRLFCILIAFSIVGTSYTFTSPFHALAEDNNALWEKFLRYDLCITDYNSLTEEEQQLCHFIFDTEQGTEEAIRCERARRTLAHDPNLGERVTVEQAENSYGIGDWYSNSSSVQYCFVNCIPDIKYLDGSESYNDYWLDDTGTDFIRAEGDWGTEREIIHITISAGGEWNEESIARKKFLHADWAEELPIEEQAWYADISGFPDIVIENGDYYQLFPETGTAALVASQYRYRQPADREPLAEPVVIPESVQGYTVTAIDALAFENAPVTEVCLPDTVQYIFHHAFMHCTQLKKINFPDSLKLLGKQAFSESGLEEISINNPGLHIFDGAFSYCRALHSAELNVKSVGEYSFYYCPNLKNVSLGDTVEKIEANAFYYPNAIQKLVLPDSVRAVGTGAFKGAAAVEIPQGVEILGALPKQKGIAPTSGIETGRTHPLTDEPECVFSDNAVIYGEAGSPAEEYAKEWGLTFIAPGMEEPFTPAGAVQLQQWVMGVPGAELTYPKACDMNGDGILNAVDISLMKQNCLETAAT